MRDTQRVMWGEWRYRAKRGVPQVGRALWPLGSRRDSDDGCSWLTSYRLARITHREHSTRQARRKSKFRYASACQANQAVSTPLHDVGDRYQMNASRESAAE